jgi:hypothetical protein
VVAGHARDGVRIQGRGIGHDPTVAIPRGGIM